MNANPGSSASSPAAEPTRPTFPAAPLEAPPETIGKFKVLQRLGAGAVGVVYKCSQPDLDRPVAVKVLLAARHASADQLARFQREARAAARLNHPNVVQVYDVGYENGLHYIVMEYIDGWPLDRLIGKPTLTAPRAVRVIYHVARALQAAHEQGVVHRDVKPSNILVQRSGLPKLSDFGLAKLTADGRALSSSGDLIGTPRYMSPEQALSESSEVDARTDIYSLGAVMYEALCGQPAVDGPNALGVLRQLSDGAPVPLRDRNPDVPEALAAVCHRALARDKADRFGTAGQFADALQAYLLEQVRGSSTGSLPVARPSLPAPATRPARRGWAWTVLALLSLGLLASLVLALLFRPPHGAPGRPDLSGLIVKAREQLDGPPSASDGDRLRARIDDLGAVLTYDPDDAEARFLRARAARRGGEHDAAISDLTWLLQKRPDDHAAALERLLAAYELNVLYLDNLQEPLLRPASRKAVAADVEALRNAGSPSERHAADLVDALARQDYDPAATLAEKGWPVAEAARVPDWAMLEADALYHAADKAFTAEQNADGDAKAEAHSRYQACAHGADHALRLGLDADPNHVGLLFLKANGLLRHAAWEAGDNEDPVKVRRNKQAFDAACGLLRRATIRRGDDTRLARAVLLLNAGRDEAALEQLSDARAEPPTAPYVLTLHAYIRLQNPPDGLLSPEDAELIVRDLQPVFMAPPDEFDAWFVRALAESATGRWESDARADLRECHRLLGTADLPTSVPAYAEWVRRADGPTLEYLNATLDVLSNVSVAPDLRVRLGEDLLNRLADDDSAAKDGVDAERARHLKGQTLLLLAHTAAAAENRDDVLKRLSALLALNLPDIATPDSLKADDAFKAWTDDAEFTALYEKFKMP
jgi:serine/threonine protein kinase